MTTMQINLFRALLDAGIAQDKASQVVESFDGELQKRVDDRTVHLASKADLATLETSLIKWNVGTIIAMSAVTAAIVRLFAH